MKTIARFLLLIACALSIVNARPAAQQITLIGHYQGFEHPLIRQLAADPTNYGFHSDGASTPDDVRSWATEVAQKYAIAAGWVDPDTGEQIGIIPEDTIAVTLGKDPSGHITITVSKTDSEESPEVITLPDTIAQANLREIPSYGYLIGGTGTKPQTMELAPAPITLSAWLDKLEQMASEGSGDARAKTDTDGIMTYGCLQLEAPTFLEIGKKFQLIPADTEKAEPIIYRCSLQKQIAAKMIEADYESWRRLWPNAEKQIGPAPQAIPKTAP